MHYGKSTFAKEASQVTILPKKDPETELIPEIGQRDQLSPGDIRQTSKMYRCSGKAKKKQNVMQTGTKLGHIKVVLQIASQSGRLVLSLSKYKGVAR